MSAKKTFRKNLCLLTKAFLLSFLVVLVSCRTSPPLPHSPQGAHWQATGRLAIAKNNQGSAASFIWEQQGDDFRIKLFGPFGARTMLLSSNAQGVEMKMPDGKVIRAASYEALLQKQLGWHIPLNGLQFNPQKKQLTLRHSGWQVEYEHYPKLFLKHDDLHIKIIITSWKPL